MLQKPVGLRALHGLQRGALLRERGVKFVVAAALLLGAFDQRAQPVGSLEQGVSSAASSAGSRAAMERTLSVSSAL